MKRINYADLKRLCLAPLKSFERDTPGWELTSYGPNRFSLFKDNGADLLAIAHLDTVNTEKHFYVVHVKGSPWVLSTGLDDRLGAYTIMHLLPQYGLKYDILLTTDEETGKSTGSLFTTTKKYKWMFECDRRGAGAVHYQYTDTVWLDAVKKHFDPVERGSGTDISHMEHLGICGVNFGVGYYNEHDTWATCNVNTYYDQVVRMVKFINEFKNKPFPHIRATTPAYTTYPSYGNYTTTYSSKTIAPKLSKKEKKKLREEQKKKTGKGLCDMCKKWEVTEDALYSNLCTPCLEISMFCEICDTTEYVTEDNVEPVGSEGVVEVCIDCRKDLKCGHLVLTKNKYCTKCRNRLWNKEFVNGGICDMCQHRYNLADKYFEY